jgi:protoheme IX farnesyltransferase
MLVLGVFLLACGASVLNQVMEYKQDGLMERTRHRPLPSQKISKKSAVFVALLLLSAGLICLGTTGWVPVLLGILNILLYNVLYTRLKKLTQWAVVPGALVGAIPPLMGYTAAGPIHYTPEILWFSGFMFLWQLPHFWLILMKYRSDYENAGFKTFSTRVKNEQIKNLIFLWVLLTSVVIGISLASGFLLKDIPAGILISVNILFIALFYRMLYKGSAITNIRNAYVMVNTFGLLVMLMFIINAMLF